ncbi:MAG: bifunctional MaoC family dehydratase N-terminal/OB-fold nucleic acid binding domain-containing protein [Myxococcota bacterium]
MADEKAELLAKLRAFEGQPAGRAREARDPVNQPMIRHWCDAVGDRNPVYTDPEFAAQSFHAGIVAPPTMLQAWNMPGLAPRPEREVPARDGQAGLFQLLDAAGFTSVVATNCRQEYARYLRPGDRLTAATEIESVSEEKQTALGTGHFVNQRMTYRDGSGAVVATMQFRLLKFRPAAGRAARSQAPAAAPRARPQPAVTPDNAFFWEGVEKRRLLIQRCAGCGKLRHPPCPICPVCRSLEWEAQEACGRGRVYSYVVAHHPPVPPFAYPHLIVLVELEEGTRLVSELVGVEPSQVEIGAPLEVEFAEVEGGRVLHRFRPVRE